MGTYIYIVQDDSVQDESGEILASFTRKRRLRNWLQTYGAINGKRFANYARVTRVRETFTGNPQQITKMLGKDILYE